MGSSVSFAGLSAARSLVARLSEALHQVAGGTVVQAAAVEVQSYVEGVARAKYGRHVASGAALGSLVVRASGALVTLSRNGYTRFHSWDSFRNGMPTFALKRASQIFAAKVLEALGDGDGAGRALAQQVAGAQAAAAERAAKKKADAATRREERAYDRRVKRQEAKEGR